MAFIQSLRGESLGFELTRGEILNKKFWIEGGLLCLLTQILWRRMWSLWRMDSRYASLSLLIRHLLSDCDNWISMWSLVKANMLTLSWWIDRLHSYIDFRLVFLFHKLILSYTFIWLHSALHLALLISLEDSRDLSLTIVTEAQSRRSFASQLFDIKVILRVCKVSFFFSCGAQRFFERSRKDLGLFKGTSFNKIVRLTNSNRWTALWMLFISGDWTVPLRQWDFIFLSSRRHYYFYNKIICLLVLEDELLNTGALWRKKDGLFDEDF